MLGLDIDMDLSFAAHGHTGGHTGHMHEHQGNGGFDHLLDGLNGMEDGLLLLDDLEGGLQF